MRIAIIPGRLRDGVTLAGLARGSVTLAGTVDAYTPAVPGAVLLTEAGDALLTEAGDALTTE